MNNAATLLWKAHKRKYARLEFDVFIPPFFKDRIEYARHTIYVPSRSINDYTNVLDQSNVIQLILINFHKKVSENALFKSQKIMYILYFFSEGKNLTMFQFQQGRQTYKFS